MFLPDRSNLDDEVTLERVRMFFHHDYESLCGFNYTESCQFSKLWNENNISCRGLIFNFDKCIARPFVKFFNIEEISEDLSGKKIKYVQNKEDGSLIISYFHEGSVRFSTRGSFHSEQAEIAAKIWKEKYDNKIPDIIFSNWTLLFELVGPLNINVSRKYKDNDLILLSINSINTGEEASEDFIAEISRLLGCQRPKLFSANSIEDLYNLIKENKDPNFEGVVVTFLDGMKVKIKSNLYVQLHKVLTGALSKDTKFDLWLEMNQNGKITSLEQLKIPDEFFSEINKDIMIISDCFDSFCKNTMSVYLDMKKDYNNGNSRKEMALKWESFRWLLPPLFLEQDDIKPYCLRVFKKNYMDGIYG